MISKKTVQGTVTAAEHAYEDCWDILLSLKQGRPDARLPHFQSLLATQLLKLRNIERAITDEQTRLIGCKQKLTKAWFSHRMRLLDAYLAILRRTAALGRGLGDAFAWFFYTNDRELLAEHAIQPMIRSLPDGIGGLGELEFVRGVGKIQGKLILHHGITTILRLGDFSLLDLQHWRVVALGEIKTDEVKPGSLRIECHYVASKKRWRPKLGKSARPGTRPADARLSQQMRRMAAGFSQSLKRIPGMTTQVSGGMYYAALEEALSRKEAVTYVHAGGGLLFCKVALPGRTLLSRFQVSTDSILSRLDSLEKQIVKIAPEPSPLNALVIGGIYWGPGDTMFPTFQLGTVPHFWWPLSNDSLHKLIFLEALVVTFFNPAHLLKELQQVGYDMAPLESGGYRIEFGTGKKKRALIENFSYYRRLVSEALHSEKIVAEIMKRASETLLERDFPPYTQIDIHYEQGMHPVPATK